MVAFDHIVQLVWLCFVGLNVDFKPFRQYHDELECVTQKGEEIQFSILKKSYKGTIKLQGHGAYNRQHFNTVAGL